jgi:hypothetical protein
MRDYSQGGNWPDYKTSSFKGLLAEEPAFPVLLKTEMRERISPKARPSITGIAIGRGGFFFLFSFFFFLFPSATAAAAAAIENPAIT